MKSGYIGEAVCDCGERIVVTAPDKFTARDGARVLMKNYHADSTMHDFDVELVEE